MTKTTNEDSLHAAGSASSNLEPAVASEMEREVGAERPHRVQLSRRKGFVLPPNTVVVSRPSKWGNPYKPGDTVAGVGMVYGRAGAVDFFNRYCFPDVSELRGKNLACWCPLDQPCHADVLLRRAGAGEETANGTREKTQNVASEPPENEKMSHCEPEAARGSQEK